MIIGIGTDLCNIDRITTILGKKESGRFIKRLFSCEEIEASSAFSMTKAAFFAKRFAAKEAFVKALGTGFRHSISFQDISISNDSLGAPKVNISGKAALLLEEKKPPRHTLSIHLSLSDDHPWALAFVVIEACPE
ncbi:Holo-[acyl-carrier-protein] synthase [Zymomonas mobilis subsp. mobilis ZM4 = ATCC 31821]|uniref:Holo-[acyl-carrier-protein] synthase n=2 Tax=Zymomonas mobilis subsp. mobilis TaxID=120045 RepID=ACPS_ZYMMO|nr:holo-ACP synthase [Zymomonas mobilis]Q5NLS7.1 RecName: Full=Holo-[acyl-carrier-protein] synthase; Short=Holo-ACP synthase; AltName: Full=4'-phosphopantetheinyl transferase AcpS [Zymomonas mobilis subsp. mobilis ZM4 = ATCC 31821]AAV90333.1 holo-acyl-carrier-protein synthase [Zymomonas mobilis subsp. mobilis ZM4 = ATCC 31821]ACV76049.1 holo-acyl-carrier-protein synthase [Zymomonas mobilis subsp. mobilis NCIMB 11163]AEH63251.1 holo-acyl-carrier-protein synthase [Zymomonas mobilis subsp. mobilis